MTHKVVDLEGKPREVQGRPVSDFWFAQMDVRLGHIEFVVTRIERQIWLIVCGAFGLLAVEIIKMLMRS